MVSLPEEGRPRQRELPCWIDALMLPAGPGRRGGGPRPLNSVSCPLGPLPSGRSAGLRKPAMLTLEMICRAQHRLRGLVHRTPLIPSAALSDYLGAKVYLKLELLQKTGSFKPRGAFNKMLALSE